MAHFYGDLQGNRGEATRMGTESSGISAHIRGWNVGIAVTCKADGDVDECIAWATGGSNSSYNKRELGRVRHPPVMNPKWKWEGEEHDDNKR